MKNNRVLSRIFSTTGLVTLGTIALVALPLLHWLDQKENKNVISRSERIWSVATLSLQRGDYAPQVMLYGQTESPKHATLKSSVTGHVQLVLAKEGMTVEKNQRLIQINPIDVTLVYQLKQAEVAHAKARIKAELTQHHGDVHAKQYEEALLALTLREYKRQAQLAQRDVGTQSDLDKAKQAVAQARLQTTLRQNRINDHDNRLLQLKAQLQQAETALKQAQLGISRTQIKAPFQGRITAVYTATGNRIQVGEPLVELFATDQVDVRAQIPVRYLRSIRQALEHKIPLSAKTQIEHHTAKLQLTRLVGEIARGQGGIDGIFSFNAIPHIPTIGRSVTLQLQLPRQHGVFRVPYSAVHHNAYVYLVKNDRLRAIPIQQVGVTYPPNTKPALLIASPNLHDGDQIVITQIPAIRSGLKVKIINAKK